MTQQEQIPLSRKRLLVYNFIAFTSIFSLTAFVAYVIIRQFSEDGGISWSRFFPSFIFLTIIVGLSFLRSIFMENPTSLENGKPKQLFRYEGEIIKFCMICMFAFPIFSQALMDYIVIPAIGYEYCEARTEYGPTFGFTFYAYVPDPALCVSPDSAID